MTRSDEQLAALVAENRSGAMCFGDKCRVMDANSGCICAANVNAIEHLQSEVARLSTPPDDAEVLLRTLRSHRGLNALQMWAMRDQAADAITRLSHALAAEKAKREAMEEALRTVETDLAEAEDKFHIASFYISDEQTKTCVMDRVKWMAKAGSRVRATLAKHGSK